MLGPSADHPLLAVEDTVARPKRKEEAGLDILSLHDDSDDDALTRSSRLIAAMEAERAPGTVIGYLN